MGVNMAQDNCPEGYKKTEVGVFPEDWEMAIVQDFATIKTGPFGTLLKASEYSESDGVPLISVGEIREGFLKITDHTPRVSGLVLRRLPQYILRRGDIVIGRKGGVERSALILPEQDGWFLGSDGISIRPSQKCHAKYVAFQFQSARIQNELLQNAIGTTMPSLNQEILGDVIIPLPPTKAEQEAIAEALSDADALIESLEQLIAKKRRIKQGAMQELLTGKRRLSGFENKHGNKTTEVGVIPADWSCSKIGDYAFVTKLAGFEYTLHFDYKKTGPIIVIRALNIKDGKLNLDDVHTISKETSNNLPRSKLMKGDLVISYVGTLGRVAMILHDDKFHLAPNVAKVTVDRRVLSPLFLSHYLNSQQGQQSILESAASTTQAALSMHNLRELFFIYPNLSEQDAIAAILTDMDTEITTLETKLSKARQLKQGMMQELLTGRIRLI